MKTALGIRQCSGPDVLFHSLSGEGKWGGGGIGEEEMAVVRKQWCLGCDDSSGSAASI